MSIFEKINVCEIIKSHFKTLYNLKTDKPNWSEIRTFYIYPLIIILMLVAHTGHTINDKLGNLLFQAFAIMGGFLINALVMLMDRRKDYDDSKKFADRVTLIEETYANTAFGVLVCFSIVLLAGIAVGTNEVVQCISYCCTGWSIIITSLTYYFSVIFIHTLAMVIKRLDKIFKH